MIAKDKMTRPTLFQSIINEIQDKGFHIVANDMHRPWGGFLVIDENQTQQFVDTFFKEQADEVEVGKRKLSPKILMVEPGKKLSWQYHHRRSEIWKVIKNTAGVIISDNDQQGEVQVKKLNDIIRLNKGQRHRLVGLEEWGIIAEIWQHTDPSNPSNEDDIVRVQDDFGRQR